MTGNLSSTNRQIVGWSLLTISFSIGLVTLYKGVFGDEADNLVVGSLISQGNALYRDVFAHHFPFPYYWVAAVVDVFGKSIFIARLSIWLFQIAAFGLSMELSGDYLSAGVAAILWSILHSFYKGNMVLYSTFAGAALLPVFIIVLAILRDRGSPSWKHWLIIGLFSSIAFLSDPLSIYAVIIALIFIFTKKPVWGMKVGLVMVCGLSLYAGYLFVSNNVHVFWSNAVLFNSQIYAKYNYTNPIRISELIDMTVKGLEIANNDWLHLNPLKPITGEYTDLDRWFFTGFLFRFSIIASTFFLAMRKKYRAAAYLYLFAASTLIINKWDFRGQPFILIAIAAISELITYEWWRDRSGKFLRIAQIAVGAAVLIMTGWLCMRLTVNIYNNLHAYGGKQFARIEKASAHILELTCHSPGVELVHYPGGTYYYWFTGMKPVSKYVYMWPWVAEVGLDEVIRELSQKQILAIVVREEGSIWDAYDTKVYLRPLDEFLAMNYQQVAPGIYRSPELESICSR